MGLMRFRDSVLIQRKTGAEGSYGYPSETWESLETKKCSIFPIDAKELYSSDAEFNEIKYRITFRYEPNLIKHGDRLIDNRLSPNRVFDVEGIIDTGNKHKLLVCKCAERL